MNCIITNFLGNLNGVVTMPEQYKNIANNEQLIQIPDIDVIYGHFNQPMAITDKYSLWPLGEPRLSCTVPAV